MGFYRRYICTHNGVLFLHRLLLLALSNTQHHSNFRMENSVEQKKTEIPTVAFDGWYLELY